MFEGTGKPLRPIRWTPLAPIQVFFLLVLPSFMACIGVYIGTDGFNIPAGAINAAWRWVFLLNIPAILAGLEILNRAENYYQREAEARQDAINRAQAAALDRFLAESELSVDLIEQIQAERQRTGFTYRDKP